MIDRQKLEAVLSRRFAVASSSQIAAAANAIISKRPSDTARSNESGRRS